jgi:hypothetical protein
MHWIELLYKHIIEKLCRETNQLLSFIIDLFCFIYFLFMLVTYVASRRMNVEDIVLIAS